MLIKDHAKEALRNHLCPFRYMQNMLGYVPAIGVNANVRSVAEIQKRNYHRVLVGLLLHSQSPQSSVANFPGLGIQVRVKLCSALQQLQMCERGITALIRTFESTSCYSWLKPTEAQSLPFPRILLPIESPSIGAI